MTNSAARAGSRRSDVARLGAVVGRQNRITEHDRVIGEHLKHVFVKASSFEEALGKERVAFQVLLTQGLTVSRIKHMLETGRPLRN